METKIRYQADTTNAPQRVQVIVRRRSYGDSGPPEPVAIKIDGEYIDWADAPVKHNDLVHLEVNGQPYRWERQYGERVQDGYLYLGHAYRLQVGYNVLITHKLPNLPEGDFTPLFDHPTYDRAEAELEARKLVTQNLSAYGTRVSAKVVKQHGEEFDEVVSTISGHDHDRQDAARAVISQEWLPLDKESTQEHDTPEATPSKVELIIAYDTDQAWERPRMGGGELVNYKTDGQVADPPTEDLNMLYRWLQAHNYAPAGFQWMGKALMGKRQRRQVYSRPAMSG